LVDDKGKKKKGVNPLEFFIRTERAKKLKICIESSGESKKNGGPKTKRTGRVPQIKTTTKPCGGDL